MAKLFKLLKGLSQTMQSMCLDIEVDINAVTAPLNNYYF